MLDTIEHRGPDTAKVHQDGDLCAGVRASRLSDVRGDGFATTGEVAVFFDGEIYNQRESGQSDAEVVVKLYNEYGRAFPGHLEGVFACAVWDGEELMLARDTVGVRPLYWGRDGDGNECFASEMKSLVGVAEEVHELLPATTCSSMCGIGAYLPYHADVHVPRQQDKAIQRVREALMDAVQRRIDDGAVGACLLSGGLDSSIIACAAHHLGLRDIPLVTVGMEGAPDIENAKIVAGQLGMEHQIHIFTPEEIEQLVPKAVWVMESFDEDCVSGTIANLIASGQAARTTNCILSGEGGDELFGGYHLLKQQPTENDKLKMMQRLIDVAYNTAVQRLDRAMMGNSINYRTPFIDAEVVSIAMQLPVQWKIKPTAAKQVEKWIIREAFRDLLPKPIYERDKLRFSGGTGTDEVMDEIAKDKLPDRAWSDRSHKTPGGYTLNSPKEMWYYTIFKERFPAPAFEALVGRWDPDK
jgi:asparagine synthase (glutamine-hydrolysing)